MSAADLCQTKGCNHRRDEHLRIGTRAGSCQVAGNRPDAVHPDDADDCVEFTEPPTVAERITGRTFRLIENCWLCDDTPMWVAAVTKDDGTIDMLITCQRHKLAAFS